MKHWHHRFRWAIDSTRIYLLHSCSGTENVRRNKKFVMHCIKKCSIGRSLLGQTLVCFSASPLPLFLKKETKEQILFQNTIVSLYADAGTLTTFTSERLGAGDSGKWKLHSFCAFSKASFSPKCTAMLLLQHELFCVGFASSPVNIIFFPPFFSSLIK